MTEGYSTTGPYAGHTYRYHLWHQLSAGGYNVDFVGTRTGTGNGDYLDPGFDRDHQARSGSDIADLKIESSGPIAIHRPDVAIIQIGINNIWGPPAPPGDPNNPEPYDPASAMTDLSAIIGNLRAANPDVIVLLGELLPCDVGMVCSAGPTYPSRIEEMNAHLSDLASEASTPQSPVVLVLLNSRLVLADLGDGLHPNDAGDQKIAGEFFDALTVLL